jgi:hypothetical protein
LGAGNQRVDQQRRAFPFGDGVARFLAGAFPRLAAIQRIPPLDRPGGAQDAAIVLRDRQRCLNFCERADTTGDLVQHPLAGKVAIRAGSAKRAHGTQRQAERQD